MDPLSHHPKAKLTGLETGELEKIYFQGVIVEKAGRPVPGKKGWGGGLFWLKINTNHKDAQPWYQIHGPRRSQEV